MYSDAELDAAVKAGVLTAPTAAAFRDFIARMHAAPGADEEHFRLLTGFSDIFVAIAATLVLVAVGWLGGQLDRAAGAAAVAGASWGLAEYFTRRRRMALPSILLLLTFVGGVLATLAVLLSVATPSLASDTKNVLLVAVCAAGTTAAAYLHWRRFMVPITLAAAAAAGAAAVWLLLFGIFPGLRPFWRTAVFMSGLAMFALAMWWDGSDRERTTRRADVAFWLHLLAAPLIVHPAFSELGLLGGGTPAVGNAALAVELYLALTLVALAVDRRALLVSALAYVLFAITTLLRGAGSVSYALALATLVIGCGLLLLSALWQRARRSAVLALPRNLQRRLPPV
jgi:hypothetical protein